MYHEERPYVSESNYIHQRVEDCWFRSPSNTSEVLPTEPLVSYASAANAQSLKLPTTKS